MQNRNIYTVKEGKSKDTKFRGLKDTNEDISISQETESKGTRQSRVKRHKETPVKLHTGEKPQSKVCTGIEKTSVQRHKKTPVLKPKGTKRKAG